MDMPKDIKETNRRFKELLGSQKGYFGRVSTWGQKPYDYEYIGFELTEDIDSMLMSMTEDQRKVFSMMITYFEIHAYSLKKVLTVVESESLDKFYSEVAWSHFAMVVMFGLLEVAVKGKKGVWLNGKGDKMKNFMENNLPQDIKDDVVNRYTVEEMFGHKNPETFAEVFDHMWENVRGGFVHDVGIESKGLEYQSLDGIGTESNPLTIKTDVPMQEWLQLTWQAILNSYGYKGKIEYAKLRSP